MKAVVAAFNQEKALVGAFSVITNLWMELFEALVLELVTDHHHLEVGLGAPGHVVHVRLVDDLHMDGGETLGELGLDGRGHRPGC